MILRDAVTGKEYSINLPCLIGRGKLLLNTEGHGVLPLLMLISRSITVESEMQEGRPA